MNLISSLVVNPSVLNIGAHLQCPKNRINTEENGIGVRENQVTHMSPDTDSAPGHNEKWKVRNRGSMCSSGADVVCGKKSGIGFKPLVHPCDSQRQQA